MRVRLLFFFNDTATTEIYTLSLHAVFRSDQLKVRITAPPVDSAANNALPKFIAKSLGVPPSAASLIRGEKSRNKTLLITGTDAQAVAEKLRAQK